MSRQMCIFDMAVADLQLQEAYQASSLVNPQDVLHTFYKIYFLLEHQNSRFKCFQSNIGSWLQETNKMFCLYSFIVDLLLEI